MGAANLLTSQMGGSSKFTHVTSGWEQVYQGMPKVMHILSQLHFENELNYKIDFLHVVKKYIKVTNSFNHFK